MERMRDLSQESECSGFAQVAIVKPSLFAYIINVFLLGKWLESSGISSLSSLIFRMRIVFRKTE